MDAARLVADALRGTGINLAGSCGIAAYDRRAPAGFRSPDVMPRARGVVVVGSAGRDLWSELGTASDANEANEGRDRGLSLWAAAHPLDTFVAGLLDRADHALARARIGSRRFEPRLTESPELDFRALGELTGLGTTGPFGLVIHPQHGPWWALRGAWLVDVDVTEPASFPAPCAGCHAPCVGNVRTEGIVLATAAVRSRCIVGQGSRYTDEQIAYHYDREATLDVLRARSLAQSSSSESRSG